MIRYKNATSPSALLPITSRRYGVIAASISIGVCCSISFASPNIKNRNNAGQSVATAQNSPTAADIKTANREFNILEKDARLASKITLDEEEDSNIGRVLRGLVRGTDVRLKIGDEITYLKDQPIRVRFTDIPLRDAMEAIAALHQLQWERVSTGVYALRGRKDFYDVYLPKGEEAIKRAATGKQFLEQFDRLSPEQKQALTTPDTSLKFSDMPTAMQAQVHSMLDSLVKEHLQNGMKATFAVGDDLAHTEVSMEVSDKGGFTNYMISVSDNLGAMGWSFNDLLERRQAADEAAKNGKRAALYDAKAHTATPDEVFGQDQKQFTESTKTNGKIVGMQDSTGVKITINQAEPTPVSKTAISLVECVKDIKGNGSYALDIDSEQAPPASVVMKNVSITNALGRLVIAYPETEWEFRRSGVLIVRSRYNGAKVKK